MLALVNGFGVVAPAIAGSPRVARYGERGYEHPLAAYHFAWPAIGHVAKQGDGFRYYPEGMAL